MSETFKNTDGRSVVASDTGENLGEIRTLIVDRSAIKVEAIHIAGRGKHADIISWGDIKAFGTDAVMVSTQAAVVKSSSEHETEAVKDRISLPGSRVLTTTGYEDGKVVDFEFDEVTGQVISVITDQGVIASDRLRSLGSYALMVDAGG